ncbi:MAG: hypothetical protein J6T72_01155 [Alphaproteobacteria bacterium]|nr:hypothetical protein [Alphaproteobacteria bacterium]
MLTIQIIAVVLILAIAYKKEIVALFKKAGERIEEKSQENAEASAPAKKKKSEVKKFLNSIDFLSDETKRFLRILCGVIISVAVLIAIFLICHLLFPGGAGYAVGSVIDVVLIILGITFVVEEMDW